MSDLITSPAPRIAPALVPADTSLVSRIPPTVAYADTSDPRFDHGFNLVSSPTQLEAGETSPVPIPDPSVSSDFRHSWWSDKRSRIRSALISADASPSRLVAWDDCGSRAWVMRSVDDPSRHRLVCRRCHDRFCLACAQEKQRRVASNLTRTLTERYELTDPAQKTDRVRFLTLTLRSTTAPLVDQIDRLYSCFGRFRHRKKILGSIRGGIAFLELTINRTTGLWHPHLHVLFEGSYLDKTLASITWKDVTGDSFIVDIRQIRSARHAAGYVAKYASKGLAASVLNSHPHLVEAIKALRGRRVFNTFGSWSALGLTDQPPLEGEWFAIASLPVLIARANAGDAEARQILASLRRSQSDEPMDAEPSSRQDSPLPDLLSGPAP